MPMTTQMVCRSWPRCAFRPPQRCHRPCDASAHRDHHSSDEPDLATAQRKTRRRPITSNHATAFDCPISARLANRPACSGQSAAHAAPLRAEVDAHIAAFAVERDKRVSQQVMADGSHTRPVLRFTPSCTCGWTRSCGRRQCPMCCRAAVGLGADWPVAVMGAVAQHGDRHIAAASAKQIKAALCSLPSARFVVVGPGRRRASPAGTHVTTRPTRRRPCPDSAVPRCQQDGDTTPGSCLRRRDHSGRAWRPQLLDRNHEEGNPGAPGDLPLPGDQIESAPPRCRGTSDSAPGGRERDRTRAAPDRGERRHPEVVPAALGTIPPSPTVPRVPSPNPAGSGRASVCLSQRRSRCRRRSGSS